MGNMIHTPQHHIPIGEMVTTENGCTAVRIKWRGKYETIPRRQFIELFFGKEIWAKLINEK